MPMAAISPRSPGCATHGEARHHQRRHVAEGACLFDALAGGVGKAHIVDGRALMPFCWRFLLTSGIGTEIVS